MILKAEKSNLFIGVLLFDVVCHLSQSLNYNTASPLYPNQGTTFTFMSLFITVQVFGGVTAIADKPVVAFTGLSLVLFIKERSRKKLPLALKFKILNSLE